VVDALAVAWTTCRVYADPRPQEAFRRALSVLGGLPSFPWVLEVHSGGFRYRGEPVPTRREAVQALARLAFARGVAVLTISTAPTADDLIRLFDVISAESGGEGDPGPAVSLARAGVASLAIGEHGLLIDAPAGLAPGDEEVLIEAEAPSPPSGDGADATGRYLGEYQLLYDRLQAGDFQGLKELVHNFTDSFFVLPREQQTRLFEQFLSRQEEAPFRLLLDQFSDEDLSQLAQLLAPEAHPLLVDYARIAAAQEAPGGGALDLLSAEELVSDRIASILHPDNADLRRRVGDSLLSQVPGPEENLRASVRGAETLLGISDEAAFARLTRVLAGKIAAALIDEDLPRAASWTEALLARSPTVARKAVVRQEVEATLRADVLDHMVTVLARGPAVSAPAPLVALVALFAPDPIVERLAREQNKARRRALLGLLTEVARVRPEPLLRRLEDSREYLVRHLVEVLGRSRKPEVASALRTACTHPSPRVRAEATRALHSVHPAAGLEVALAAAADPSPLVRLQALGVFRSDPDDPRVDAALAACLARRPSAEEQIAAVVALAPRSTPAARALLRKMARRGLRPRISREARRAARRALVGGWR
jgi:hypothetical protein